VLFGTFRQTCRRLYGFARGLVALSAALLVLVVSASDMERMQQFVAGRFGSDAVRNLRDWRDALARMSGIDETERLRRVNEFFNRRIQFQDDVVIWSNVDYWATPLETLGRGAGDCEDFAIAKYFSLIELGVPAAKMRLTYVRARIGAATSTVTQAHMVLSYYAQPDAEPLVLDNLITDIRPAGRRPDLTPVFSFNGDGVWMAGADRPAAPVDRLTRWMDVMIRMKAAGYEP
jgi:predicted transglutaminase-like cysteine proteinase